MKRNLNYIFYISPFVIWRPVMGFMSFAEPTDAAPDPGQVDFSKTIAIGSSVTAGGNGRGFV